MIFAPVIFFTHRIHSFATFLSTICPVKPLTTGPTIATTFRQSPADDCAGSLIRSGRIFVFGRATAILVGFFHAFLRQFRRDIGFVVGQEGWNSMAGHIRALVPSSQIFIARWNFRRGIRGGTGQFLEGVCAVGIGSYRAAILFGHVLGALLEKLIRDGANSHSLSFDFA